MPRPLLFVLLVVLAACSRQDAPRPAAQRPVSDVAPGRADVGGATVNLPRQVGEWTRPDAARRITAETIFDYMDGAGEMYLAYRFDHLDVFDYKPADASLGTILLEIYSMKTSDDAFGLLSNDWGGEVIAGMSPGGPPAVPERRALYGGGLLRIATGSLYVRVLAARETPTSREAVLTIGRNIMTPPGPGIPPLLARASCTPADGSAIRSDRTCYFRSHLVLNAQYFLASEDILGLGLDVDAVTFEYRAAAGGARPTRVILARYPDVERARTGLSRFLAAYLRPAERKQPNAAAGSAQTEHGWVSWSQKARDLVIVLDAATAVAARDLAACTLAAAPAPATTHAN